MAHDPAANARLSMDLPTSIFATGEGLMPSGSCTLANDTNERRCLSLGKVHLMTREPVRTSHHLKHHWELGEQLVRGGSSNTPVSYTHLTLPTICSV
eukprot:9494873-Alexandrium_andersonii.AAC.1